MYRPLLDCLTVKPSEIDGLGLFASKDIPAGADLGISHYFILGELIRTPLGGFYNHSDTDANCFTDVRRGCVHLMTKRSIVAGEELTAFYKINPLKK